MSADRSGMLAEGGGHRSSIEPARDARCHAEEGPAQDRPNWPVAPCQKARAAVVAVGCCRRGRHTAASFRKTALAWRPCAEAVCENPMTRTAMAPVASPRGSSLRRRRQDREWQDRRDAGFSRSLDSERRLSVACLLQGGAATDPARPACRAERHASSPVPVQGLNAQVSRGGTQKWTWPAEPSGCWRHSTGTLRSSVHRFDIRMRSRSRPWQGSSKRSW